MINATDIKGGCENGVRTFMPFLRTLEIDLKNLNQRMEIG